MTTDEGICIYCHRSTQATKPAACVTQANGKDYGHDYCYDPTYVADWKACIEAAMDVF